MIRRRTVAAVVVGAAALGALVWWASKSPLTTRRAYPVVYPPTYPYTVGGQPGAGGSFLARPGSGIFRTMDLSNPAADNALRWIYYETGPAGTAG